MKPRIVLSARSKPDNYISAVENCGGEPFVTEGVVSADNYDGLILCGGGDIHPRYYGEEIDGSIYIDEERDEAEYVLIRSFLDAGKPILGICRGHQILNVYFGGTMYQHIPTADKHSSTEGIDKVHVVECGENSPWRDSYGEIFSVNSSHHQAVKDLGEGFLISLTSENGQVIEGIEHESLPIFGVQWHPERMCFGKCREDTVDGAEVIRRFLAMCQKTEEM